MGNSSTTHIHSITTGVSVGGNLDATNVTSLAGPSSCSTINEVKIKSPFRFNVPTPNPNYKGRKDTLTAIQQHFSNLPRRTNTCWDRMVAVVGLGGMGKTETAYKFAAKYRRRFPNVAWINAETEEVTRQSFLDLAKQLGITLQNQQTTDVCMVKEIYRQFDQNKCGNVLFIFDNAMQLNSGATEFGIMDFLPTTDLPNGRFPYILITTQADDWGQHIKTFEVGGLSEQESLEFFKSSFKVKSSVCNEEFKRLYDLMHGYPLIMNLAASQIDYNPNTDKVSYLQQQINEYIDKVTKEQSKLTCEQISPAKGNKYNKTLASVWKLTFERLLAAVDGLEALEILQIMSFLKLPIDLETVDNIFFFDSELRNNSKPERQLRLKQLVRVLEKLHVARIFEIRQVEPRNQFWELVDGVQGIFGANDWSFRAFHMDDKVSNRCEVGIHRLIQLVVRQETDCSKILERVFCYSTSSKHLEAVGVINTSILLQSISQKPQLSSRELACLGWLACQFNFEAYKFEIEEKPKTEPAATLWRSNSFNGDVLGVNACVRLMLMDVNGRIKSSKKQEDSDYFAEVLLQVVCLPKLVVKSDTTEAILAEYLRNLFCLEELPSVCLDVFPEEFPDKLAFHGVALTKRLIQEDAPTLDSLVVAERLAATWLAIIRKLSIDEFEWRHFWVHMYETSNSPEASPIKIAELRMCLWNQSLAEVLIQAFEWLPPESFFTGIVECMDICLDGVDILDTRAQKVVSAFNNMVTRWWVELRELPPWSPPGFIAVIVYEVSCVWIKLLLVDGGRNLESLLESMSRCKALSRLEESTNDIILEYQRTYCWPKPTFHKNYTREYFPQFIQRYSTCKDTRIKALVSLCTKAISEPFFTNEI